MTRDVFKYFKHVRSLQEDKGAEKAAELGYQHQARGVYLDPKTQKRYKNVGDKLEPIVVEPTAEKGGGQQKPDTKSLGQFNKDATGTQPEAQPTTLPQIPDGVSGDEFAAAKAKEFTGGRDVTPERKKFLDKVSKTLVALGNRQAASEVADEEEPETPEETKSPEEKTADDFLTIDQKLEQESEEATEENDLDDDEAFETEYQRFQQEAEETMRGLADRQRKMMEKKFGKFTESLNNIPSATDKKSFLASMAHAKTFEGRVNAGAGKNNLGYADVQNLEANRDRLIKGYGDGSPKQIKKFVDSVRSIEVSDDFVDTSYDVLPETF